MKKRMGSANTGLFLLVPVGGTLTSCFAEVGNCGRGGGSRGFLVAALEGASYLLRLERGEGFCSLGERRGEKEAARVSTGEQWFRAQDWASGWGYYRRQRRRHL